MLIKSFQWNYPCLQTRAMSHEMCTSAWAMLLTHCDTEEANVPLWASVCPVVTLHVCRFLPIKTPLNAEYLHCSIFSVATLSECYFYSSRESSESSLTLSHSFPPPQSNQLLTPIYLSHLTSPQPGLAHTNSHLEERNASDTSQHLIWFPLKSSSTLLPL